MSDTPPIEAAYPRPEPHSGSAAHLQDLSEGYFGLAKAFYLVILENFLQRQLPDDTLAIVCVVGGIVIGLFSHPKHVQIGKGAEWSSGRAIAASVFMGVMAGLGLGVFSVIVMLTIAANNMKRFGIKGGFFGLRRSDVAPILRDLRAREKSNPA